MMKLQYNIDKLPPTGKNLSIIFNKDDIHLSKMEDTIKATISIKKSGNVYKSKGYLDYNLLLECSRCLNPFKQHKRSDFEFEFERIKNEYMKSQEEIEEMEKNYIITNGTLDFEPIFYDLIVLSIPIKPLCNKDCRGFCQICGTNLNIVKCEHIEG